MKFIDSTREGQYVEFDDAEVNKYVPMAKLVYGGALILLLIMFVVVVCK